MNMQQEATEKCENCLRNIPVSNAATHLGYCRRNIVRCKKCDEVYDKNLAEQHEQEFHQEKECKYCKGKFNKLALEKHNQICQKKPIVCQYCENDVPPKEFSKHLKQCQSRTAQCQLCQKAIVNKNYASHKAVCKGNQQSFPKNPRNPETYEWQFQDSLAALQRNAESKKQERRGIKKQTNVTAYKSQIPKNGLKQGDKHQQKQKGGKGLPLSQPKVKFLGKQQIKPQPFLPRSAPFNNYLGNPAEQLQEDYDIGYQYLQESLFRQAFKNPKISYIPNSFGEISIEDQLLQSALLDGRGSKHFQRNQPLSKDFASKQIMNCSFYINDTLDIEKQRAIEQDLQRSKQSRIKSRKR